MTDETSENMQNGGGWRPDGRMGICRDFFVILQLRQLNTNQNHIMRRRIKAAIMAAVVAMAVMPMGANAQFNLGKAINAGVKGVQALTISDKDMANYSHESVQWMDTHNKVSDANSEYTKRLNRLTEGITDADGIPLNFKVYEVIDVNAFACPDGSVRVFSSLMDIMDDDELMGIIGHEIGHVTKRHSKKAFKQELLTGAALDAISSAGGTAAALSSSVLGQLGQALASAKYSQAQEKEADDAGYEFLVAKGRNPWGMVMAFEKFRDMEAKAGSGKASYFQRMFSSHPETEARIKRMTKRCEKDGIARPAKK